MKLHLIDPQVHDEGKDLLLQFGLEPRIPEVMDSSMLRDFVDCPSMFYLRHILGLRPRILTPDYTSKFDWGICWHNVMEAYYRESDDPSAGNPEAALSTLEATYPTYLTPDVDRYKRSKERMVKQFFDYHERMQTIGQRYEILRHEQFFDFYNEEEDLRWCGRIDSIRRKKRGGSIVIWDYKTSSSMGDNYFPMHEMGFQLPGYAWGGNQMFPEEVLECVLDVMYTISRSHDFFLRTFRYDAFRRAEWVRNVKGWISRIEYLCEHHLYEPWEWSQNRNECVRYGKCSFFDIHNLHPKGDTRFRILRDDFIVDRWDPSDITFETADD